MVCKTYSEIYKDTRLIQHSPFFTAKCSFSLYDVNRKYMICNETEYIDTRNEVRVKLGKEPSNYEVMTAFLTKECGYLASRNDWGLYTNVIGKQAELSKLMGNNKEALMFYLTICYLDMNGPNNLGEMGRTPGIKRFDPQDWPLIVEPIIKINKSLNLSEEEIKKLFFDYNKMIQDSLKLPVSLKKAWDRIEKEAFNKRDEHEDEDEEINRSGEYWQQ